MLSEDHYEDEDENGDLRS